jgi:acyl carrier protein
MDKEKCFEKVAQIFKEIFDDDRLEISDATCAEDIYEWDSLNHINLVAAIEQEFEVKFALAELERLRNVGDMINLLLTKVGRRINE